MTVKLALSLCLVLCVPLQVEAMTWNDAVAATEAKSQELWELAAERGMEGRHLGTGVNELHIDEHRCSILGRMLGKPELVADIERSTEIDTTNADGYQTGLAAHSLGNWSYSARLLLDTSEAKRVREWNLDCVGQMGIPSSAYVGELSPSTFYDVDREILRIMGDVETGFADKLRQALDDNPSVKTVALGSGGGSVAEAVNAGYLIRERGLETTLWNNCYSACTIVFIGGIKRSIWSPYPDLSFHQVSIDGIAVPSDDVAYLHIARFVAAMGVDVRVFLELMLSASPSSFTTPSPAELCEPRIATWVQRNCGF